jgi:hypothetical protein
MARTSKKRFKMNKNEEKNKERKEKEKAPIRRGQSNNGQKKLSIYKLIHLRSQLSTRLLT